MHYVKVYIRYKGKKDASRDTNNIKDKRNKRIWTDLELPKYTRVK